MTENNEEVKQLCKEDIKAILGTPKITFVLGGPASGKGTQCEKIVEEFGYTHISTGDLMRAEMKKGTKTGDEIQKIVDDGQLVPYELTVQVLINGMCEKPSKNYLIDGFPRALDQALHFEANCCEAQSVLYFNVPEEVCIARCMERAKTSERTDDNEKTIKKRFTNYIEQTSPVIEMYEHFGKVHEIDGTRDVNEVYAEARKCLLPQVSFIVGPQGSGKSSISKALCACTNMTHLDFPKFLCENGLEGKDDETVTCALIKRLSEEIKPRVLLESFPQNEFQAKFFMKNCVVPSKVFILKCGKDVCQERMFALGESHPCYLPSPILSKQIGDYNNRAKKLSPFLIKSCSAHVIDSSVALNQSIKQVRSFVAPTIVHIRSSGSENSIDIKEQIRSNLVEELGFIELAVNDLTREEMERRTDLGLLLLNAYNTGQSVTNEMYVSLLAPVIFSGHECRDKFLLTGFPEIIENVEAFEENCTIIKGIILATDEGETVKTNNELSLGNIDTQFQKECRLKPMTCWNQRKFEEHMGDVTQWGLISGRKNSGKSTIAKEIAKLTNGHSIDMNVISEEVKKRLTEAAGEDGAEIEEVPIKDVEKAICDLIKGHQAAGKKVSYIFDGYLQKSAADFFAFACEAFGPPKFWLPVTCNSDTVGKRWKVKNDQDADADIGEEQMEEFKLENEAAEAEASEISGCVDASVDKVCLKPTDCAQTSTVAELKSKFCAKIVVINHDPRLSVDVSASNLAIKYNMLYLSVPQIIQQNITTNTDLGKKLSATRKDKTLIETFNAIGNPDPHDELHFSAAHFDLTTVCEVVQATIAEKRSNQSFILLEGVCNSGKLLHDEDKLDLRYMDELFMIEKTLGDVEAVCSLTFNKEENFTGDESKLTFEVFEKPAEPEEKKAPVEGEEAEQEQIPEEEDEAAKKEKERFKPEAYQWTVTNGAAKNLLTVFANVKGEKVKADIRDSATYGVQSYEAVTKGLDDFCERVCAGVGENKDKNLYLQVLFSDNN